MLPQTLGLIGLNAVGGSVGLRAAQAGVGRIIGHAPEPRDGVEALRAGAVTELVPDVRPVLRNADFIVLALSPNAVHSLLTRAAQGGIGSGAVVTDVGNVKQPLIERAREMGLAGAFAGSNPLVDVPQTGFGGAHADLFAGRIVYVTPVPHGERAAREVADFWKRVMGAAPVVMDAPAHDAAMAWTAHAPHAVASALAAACASGGPKGVTYSGEALAVTGPALRDVTLWTELMLLNREEILRMLPELNRSVEALETALQRGDAAAVRAWLEHAQRWRRRVEP